MDNYWDNFYTVMDEDYLDVSEISLQKCLQDITMDRFIWLVNPQISMEHRNKYYCSYCSMQWNQFYKFYKCCSKLSWLHIKEYHQEEFYETMVSSFFNKRAVKAYNYLRRRYALMVSYITVDRIRFKTNRVRSLRWSSKRQALIENSIHLNCHNIFGKLRIYHYDTWRVVILFL